MRNAARREPARGVIEIRLGPPGPDRAALLRDPHSAAAVSSPSGNRTVIAGLWSK